MLNYISIKNKFLIHKYVKILIDINFDEKGAFSLGPKLNMMLNQRGIYELENIVLHINTYFEYFKKFMNLSSIFTFLIPILIIFPKHKFGTLIYLFNPFITNYLMNAVMLNTLDMYLYLKAKFFIDYFFKRRV